MTVSIIIRARNEADSIGKVLQGITNQVFDGQIETLLVDTASTDGTPEIARQFGCRVLPITPETFTWGYALNYGASQSTGDILINLSAHAIPADPYWLAHLIAPFLNDDRVAGVFGRQLASTHGDPFEAVELDLWFPDWPEPRRSNSFSNANGALRRSVWGKMPFDEHVMIGEDSVWAKKVSDLGYHTVYQPLSRVYHNHDLEVSGKESTNSIFIRWYWRSYTMPLFNTHYRGARLKYVLRQYLTYGKYDFKHLIKHRLLKQIFKIPIYEFIRQYASWRGARDYANGYKPNAPTWRGCYFSPKPPAFIRLLGIFL